MAQGPSMQRHFYLAGHSKDSEVNQSRVSISLKYEELEHLKPADLILYCQGLTQKPVFLPAANQTLSPL